MKRVAVLLAVAMFGSTGCATGARAYMDAPDSNAAESATIWNRPQEVGFDIGEEISGEATQQCVLGIACWGAEGGGDLFSSVTEVGALILGPIGLLLGGAAASAAPPPAVDPLVKGAAAVAVESAAKADGIFITAHNTDSMNLFIYSRRHATVRGKAITLRKMGEVSLDRAEKYRDTKALATGQSPF